MLYVKKNRKIILVANKHIFKYNKLKLFFEFYNISFNLKFTNNERNEYQYSVSHPTLLLLLLPLTHCLY